MSDRRRRTSAFRLLTFAVSVTVLGVADPAMSIDVQPQITEVATPYEGSSDPTLYANNRRMATTAGGRLLALFDPHGSGQQLTWKAPGGVWQRVTRGAVANGFFPGDVANDRPTSIALGVDSNNLEHAWVVWAGYTTTRISALKMRRVSELDHPDGPLIGPEVTLEPADRGNFRPDIAFEISPDGKRRGVISWLKRTGDKSYDMVVTWFTDLDANSPTTHDRTVLFTTSSSSGSPTLVPTAQGMRSVVRTPLGKLQVLSHNATEPLSRWSTGPATRSVSSSAKPSAVLMGSSILATVESNTSQHVVRVYRYSASGETVVTEVDTGPGYIQPTIATDGARAWVVMVRVSDGHLVSREFTSAGWSTVDRTEMGPETGGNYGWPNAMREVADGRLRILVRGPKCPCTKQSNAVLAYERSV